jgi:hypothetical protein
MANKYLHRSMDSLVLYEQTPTCACLQPGCAVLTCRRPMLTSEAILFEKVQNLGAVDAAPKLVWTELLSRTARRQCTKHALLGGWLKPRRAWRCTTLPRSNDQWQWSLPTNLDSKGDMEHPPCHHAGPDQTNMVRQSRNASNQHTDTT